MTRALEGDGWKALTLTRQVAPDGTVSFAIEATYVLTSEGVRQPKTLRRSSIDFNTTWQNSLGVLDMAVKDLILNEESLT